jgi:hypothetical protein
VQSVFGVGWQMAYLASVMLLHLVLYGSLGLVSAFAVGPGETRTQRWVRLLAVPLIVVAVAVVIRSLKLGFVPMLGNALVPMAACTVGAMTGLLVRQHGWGVTAAAIVVLGGGLLWSFYPGASDLLRSATSAQLGRLAEARSSQAAGDERFGVLLQTVFAPVPATPPLPAVEDNRSALLALGIAIGHDRLARFAGLDRRDEVVQRAMAVGQQATLRGRGDWAKHFCLSGALAVLENPFLSDVGGLLKEEVDALAKGTGFSFGDLAADRAGVRFAHAATASEDAAAAMQARLRRGYSADDFFPPASDLPENLTVEEFRRSYRGVGDERYRQKVREIEARLDRCPGLVPQQ